MGPWIALGAAVEYGWVPKQTDFAVSSSWDLLPSNQTLQDKSPWIKICNRLGLGTLLLPQAPITNNCGEVQHFCGCFQGRACLLGKFLAKVQRPSAGEAGLQF